MSPSRFKLNPNFIWRTRAVTWPRIFSNEHIVSIVHSFLFKGSTNNFNISFETCICKNFNQIHFIIKILLHFTRYHISNNIRYRKHDTKFLLKDRTRWTRTIVAIINIYISISMNIFKQIQHHVSTFNFPHEFYTGTKRTHNFPPPPLSTPTIRRPK